MTEYITINAYCFQIEQMDDTMGQIIIITNKHRDYNQFTTHIEKAEIVHIGWKENVTITSLQGKLYYFYSSRRCTLKFCLWLTGCEKTEFHCPILNNYQQQLYDYQIIIIRLKCTFSSITKMSIVLEPWHLWLSIHTKRLLITGKTH